MTSKKLSVPIYNTHSFIGDTVFISFNQLHLYPNLNFWSKVKIRQNSEKPYSIEVLAIFVKKIHLL